MTGDVIHGVSRTLIETFVRKKLIELKDNPERGTRNLIDMALNFSQGRFEKRFFTAAQQMLQNEQSGYYSLIWDTITHVTLEHMLEFGMNVGYNSLNAGAKLIREQESQCGYNIPWTIALRIDGGMWDAMAQDYKSLVEQGKEKGIYTWMARIRRRPEAVLPMIEAEKDCAFLLFIEPEDMTDAFLDAAAQLKNMMPVVGWSEKSAEICRRMREREMLYALFVPYDGMDAVPYDEILRDAGEMHPFITFFLSDEVLEGRREDQGEIIGKLRAGQKYATIPMELYADSLLIDGVISDEACLPVFDESGTLIGQRSGRPLNFIIESLSDILKAAYPKKAAQ